MPLGRFRCGQSSRNCWRLERYETLQPSLIDFINIYTVAYDTLLIEDY